MLCSVFLLFLFITVSVTQDWITPATPPKLFRKDYTYKSSTERFYKFHKIPLSFQDAVNLCKYEGAEIAVPKTEGEATILTNLFPEGVHQIWVGLHDIYAEGDFVTLDGKSIDEMYSKWNQGEPNDANGGEDCIEMIENKMYNDGTCNTKLNFICSKDESCVDYNYVCESYDKDYFYEKDGDRCYKLHSIPKTWHEAVKICRAEEAALAIVNSDVEARYLTNKFNREHPANSLKGNFDKGLFFVDFSDLITPGLYVTFDGTMLSDTGYDTWASGQPDNWNGAEHCGSVFRTGELNDANCNSRALFYCEKTNDPPSIASLERAGYNRTSVFSHNIN